jgi:prolipoprotein diacylglyceryltransferase
MISFLILYRMYWKTEARYQQGKIFGAFMILIWSARFIVEFVKEGQSSFDESGVTLNTGQLLSIPFVILGLYLYFRKQKPEAQETYKQLVDTPLNA